MLDLNDLHKILRREGGINRRLFLGYSAALAGLPFLADRARGAQVIRSYADYPFGLGIASGDPDHTGVVLWTRLAPSPLEPDGGMEPISVEVQWEVAEDEGMSRIVQKGVATATPLLGHSVHVEVNGLQPDRWYWYRFRTGDAESPVGRTRTMPAPDAMPEQLRFGVASCQHYETGYYTAYEQMAKDELDLVFHLGDYIYEYAGQDDRVRKHAAPKLTNVTDYRIRHAQYRTDPLLQAVHARCPWFVTWDDHEVENNYAEDISQDNLDPAEFLIHRANAYQAYYENMPLRRQAIPRGPDMQLYRKATFGRLGELLVLDTRQYRSDQPNDDRHSDLNAAALDPKQSLLGARQKAWLEDALRSSHATWNVLAQQVMMGMVDREAGAEVGYSMDQWPGYAHERMQLVQFMADHKVSNPVVLTGDIHSNWVNDLRVDDREPETPIIGTEFVGTSISSGGNGVDRPKNHGALLAENPCLRFHNAQRGYMRCTLTPSTWRTDYMVVDFVDRPGGIVSNRASFVVEAGQPGALPA